MIWRRIRMKNDLLRAFDRWLALPLCFVARWLNRNATPSARTDIGEAPTICVAKFAGLGSILNTTPLLRAVRRRYPSARIVYLTFAKHRELVRRMALIDECLYIDDRSIQSLVRSFLLVNRRLHELNVKYYLDLQYYNLCYFSALLAVLCGASRTIGFFRQSNRIKSCFFTQAIYFNSYQPLQRMFREMARAVGGDSCDLVTARERSLVTFPQDHAEIKRLLSSWNNGLERLLVVNANASSVRLERRWPRESFARTASELLVRLPDLRVALIGTDDERDYVEELSLMIGGSDKRVLNLAGMLSLGGLIALLNDADCLLTNDTGPMHAAFALKTPTVALFGPSNPRDQIAQADLQKTIIFYGQVFCSPCVHFISPTPCGGINACMRQISVSSVRAACLALLTGSPPREIIDAWSQPLSHERTVEFVS